LSGGNFKREVFDGRACLDLAHDPQCDRQMCQVFGPHRVAISHGTPERREVAIRNHFLSQHSAVAG
jgi:hypothetical protein